MNTRCKVICLSKTENHGGFYSLVFSPVTANSEENKTFYKWTPTGKFQFDTINPVAADNFKVGQEYYLDFIPANS